MITIGIATAGDCPALSDLLTTLFSQEAEFTPNPIAQTRGIASIIADENIGRIFVARDDERVIGMVSLLYTISTALGGRVAMVEDMVVCPQDRGRGVGSHLLTAAIAFARSQGCRRLTLLTDGDNGAAQDFYRKHGFAGSVMIPMRLAL